MSGPHRAVVEASVKAPDGSISPVPITDGTVTLDATAASRGRCDIQVDHLDWIPRGAGDRLAPFGSEINIRRGVKLPSGELELVSLGWFPIEDAEITDDGSGPGVRVAALDRADRMSKAKFENTWQLEANTAFTDGIMFLALEADPSTQFMPGFASVSTISIGKPIIAQAGDDRWEFMQGLATALGMVLFFDGDGILTLRRYAEQGVVMNLVEGEGGVLLTASRSWSRTNAHNKWIVTGEATDDDTVYRAEAADLNPASPTYYDGPFGRCPGFYSSGEIGSDAQAQDVADMKLAKEMGAPSTVSFGMVPNPALEPEDTVLISRPVIGVDENHIIDTLTIGLSPTASMTGTTRERITF